MIKSSLIEKLLFFLDYLTFLLLVLKKMSSLYLHEIYVFSVNFYTFLYFNCNMFIRLYTGCILYLITGISPFGFYVEPPHLIHNCCVWYQNTRIRTIRSEIPLLISFVNNVQWLTRSRKHVYTEVLCTV